jgi:hypothetical protein
MRPLNHLSLVPRVSSGAGLNPSAKDALSKEIAAPTSQGGREARKDVNGNGNGKAGRRASLQMVPIWSNDRCLVGWLSLTEATVLGGGL